MTGLPIDPDRTAGVVEVSSPDYVRHMLAHLRDGTVSVPLRGADDAERLARSGAGRVVTPDAAPGWVGGGFTSRGGDDPAQLSFSSGTEGAPKAVLLSRGNLHDVVTRLTAAMGITGEIREYVGVPVYHSFGYGRARVCLNAGGDCFVPERGFQLPELRAMLRAGEVNAVSAVPSQWRIFLQNRDLFGDELDRIRWVEIGSQPMTGPEKAALRAALPGARIVQHYGLTEASRTTLLRIDAEDAGALASVGRAEGDVGLRITEDGRIAIRGPHVALGVDDGTGYRAHGEDDWLVTGDLGRIEDGLLFYEGRADDMINCGGIKLAPDAIEDHVRGRVDAPGDFGVLGVPDTLRGDGIMIALTPESEAKGDAIRAAVADYAAARRIDAAGAIRSTVLPALPRTATGKLQRKALAADLQAAPGPAPRPGGAFARMLTDLLGPQALEPGTRFHDLGGDSLNHMQISLALERALGATPDQWEDRPLADLAAEADAAVTGDDAFDPALLYAGGGGAAPLPDGSRNMNPPGLGFWALVAEDFRTNDANPFHQGFLMLLVHRFGNWRMGVRPRLLRAPLTLLYLFLNKLTQLFFGMKLDYTVQVGRRVKLEHFGGMILGARAIGDDVILRQNTTLGIRSLDDLNAKPTLQDNVDVGAGAVIVGDITVGAGSVIGANSVVYANVPPGSVVVGVPGRVIGRRPEGRRRPDQAR